ncbi:hypothetical protein [Maritalea porphyrae]|uniref:hypothetical protein n=1 Tax=Maritalea porphyrae TaxID=880732 RepID=UPI0022AEF893|nr:hypothetical protein [Maritalea porphyrae]MCZ4273221.1 hypothetical protein [Maritalea porphyrae]
MGKKTDIQSQRFLDLEEKVERLANQMSLLEPRSSEIIEVPECAIETEIFDEDLLRKSIDLSKPKDLELRFSSWTYKWDCGPFNHCETTYIGSCFVINKTNGKTMNWNLMESASRKDHGAVHWSISPYYHHRKTGTTIGFGFGKQVGRSCHVSSNANFFADWGKVSFTWTSTAC